MYGVRFAMNTGHARATRVTRRDGDRVRVAPVPRKWSKGEICLARIIGEKRAPAIVVGERAGRVIVFTLHRVPHSVTGEMVWTIDDTMEPRSADAADVKEVSWDDEMKRLLDEHPITNARRTHLLDTISLWCSVD